VDRIPLISAMYFGPVELYAVLARHPVAVIDLGEHYERQSHRTRTRIIGPNGAQDLVVTIARRHGEKMPMHSVGLSYTETWPQQHMHALRSAYGKTPWAIHFLDDLETLLLTRHERLVDLDLLIMRQCLQWCGIRCDLQVSREYVPPGPVHLDLRTALHPKRPLPSDVRQVAAYPQVFSDRHGHIPRMSIIDLLCNTGPRALEHLLA
jgi:hypothetical protein